MNIHTRGFSPRVERRGQKLSLGLVSEVGNKNRPRRAPGPREDGPGDASARKKRRKLIRDERAERARGRCAAKLEARLFFCGAIIFPRRERGGMLRIRSQQLAAVVVVVNAAFASSRRLQVIETENSDSISFSD